MGRQLTKNCAESTADHRRLCPPSRPFHYNCPFVAAGFSGGIRQRFLIGYKNATTVPIWPSTASDIIEDAVTRQLGQVGDDIIDRLQLDLHPVHQW